MDGAAQPAGGSFTSQRGFDAVAPPAAGRSGARDAGADRRRGDLVAAAAKTRARVGDAESRSEDVDGEVGRQQRRGDLESSRGVYRRRSQRTNARSRRLVQGRLLFFLYGVVVVVAVVVVVVVVVVVDVVG